MLPPFFADSTRNKANIEAYAKNSFQCVGRYQRYAPVRNRLVPSETALNLLAEVGVDLGDDYGLAECSSEGTMRNLAKYNGPELDVSSTDGIYEAVSFALDWVVREFGSMRASTRVLTLDEVLASVELDKSPGFPWNSRGYQTHEDVIAAHRPWLEEYIKVRQEGVFFDVMWNAFPKEELRPAEKLRAGKIRHISGCPTEFKLFVDTVLLAQNEAFYDAHAHTWSCVGLDITKGGWDELAQRLKAACPDNAGFLEGDINQQDANYSWFLARVVAELRHRLLPEHLRTPHMRSVIFNIYRNIYKGSQITSDGWVWTKGHGNASGSPLTVVDNTFGTIISILISYWYSCKALCLDPYAHDPRDFADAAVYGDDNDLAVTPGLGRSVFTADALRAGFAKVGWTLEFAHNGFQSLEQTTFLSRRFVLHDGMYVPVFVDPQKYLYSLVLKSRKSDSLEELYIRAAGLYTSVYWHRKTRAILEHVMDRIEEVWRKRHVQPARDIINSRHTPQQIEFLYKGRRLADS